MILRKRSMFSEMDFICLYKVVLFCVCLLPRSVLAAIDSNPPKVFFIVADDLGWNDVEWRDPNLRTPNLNRLSSQGIILNSSYVQQVCSPSRSAFMSGYFPIHTGLQMGVIEPMQPVGLPLNITTLPQQLKKQGYATHMVGKWHLGFCNWNYTPTYRGFDSFYGYYNAAEDYYTHVTSWAGNGFDFRNNLEVDHEDDGVYSAYLYEKRTLDIINSHNKSQPLFLYLPFQSVHSPNEAPEEYVTRYCSQTQDKDRRMRCAMIAVLDEAVGNITRVLDDSGYLDNALLIFTTDNGGPSYEGANNWPLRGCKTTLWEGGTRGTSFVYSKNLLAQQAGTTYEGLMHAVDWYPTIMHAVKGVSPVGMDGMSQWNSWVNGAPSPRTEFVYNYIKGYQEHGAIRKGDWKLIRGDIGRYNGWYPLPGEKGYEELDRNIKLGPNDYQLYNIKDDPTEHHDVKDKYPDIVAKMKTRMEQWAESSVPYNFPPNNPASNPKNFGGAWSPGWC